MQASGSDWHAEGLWQISMVGDEVGEAQEGSEEPKKEAINLQRGM